MFNDDGEMQIAATKSDLQRQLQVGVSARLVEKVDATVIDGCALQIFFIKHVAAIRLD